MFNAEPEAVEFRLPDRNWGRRWTKVVDTSCEQPLPDDDDEQRIHRPNEQISVEGRSIMVLRHRLATE